MRKAIITAALVSVLAALLVPSTGYARPEAKLDQRVSTNPQNAQSTGNLYRDRSGYGLPRYATPIKSRKLKVRSLNFRRQRR